MTVERRSSKRTFTCVYIDLLLEVGARMQVAEAGVNVAAVENLRNRCG